MKPIPAPASWPFPKWELRQGRWVMVKTKPVKPAYPAGEPALL